MTNDVMNAQSMAGKYASNILTAVENNQDYNSMNDNIISLRRFPVENVSNPLPILYDLIAAVCHQKSAILPSEFKLRILQLVAAYSNVTYAKFVANSFQIDQNDRKLILSNLTKLQSLSKNDPLFENLLNYYTLYARSVFELIKDNHTIDWIHHGINVIQTATSFFGVGESKLKDIGGDIASSIKEKISNLLTLKKYEQILMIIGMQTAAVNSADEFKLVSSRIKDILQNSDSPEVIFAHIDVLESIISQSTDVKVQIEALSQLSNYSRSADEGVFSKLKNSCLLYTSPSPRDS
eukprot:TRINITY_DN17947_c0_g1_i1.p1 TRINITY_DN17947_c0_g1~~TRINITY_DN17947_c0_g1_i1.p1  ORF type:complete len:294 (+),score=36.64 TRINITY_DN17947_c0_g1_i1:184-1065(+)